MVIVGNHFQNTSIYEIFTPYGDENSKNPSYLFPCINLFTKYSPLTGTKTFTYSIFKEPADFNLRNIHPLRGRKRIYIFDYQRTHAGFTKYSPLTGTKTVYHFLLQLPAFDNLRNIHPLRGRKLNIVRINPNRMPIYEIFTHYGDENSVGFSCKYISAQFTKYSPLTGTKTNLHI